MNINDKRLADRDHLQFLQREFQTPTCHTEPGVFRMVTLPKASDIGSLQWDDATAHADFDSDIDEFNSAVWIKLDAVVGQTYNFTANSLGNGPRDTSFEIYNAAGDLVLSETSDVATGANGVLTASETAPVYVKLFMPSGLPGEVDLDVSTSDLTDHYLGIANNTYTGTFGERILGYYGDDVLVVNNATEASGGTGNDTIYCNTTQDAVWGDQGDDTEPHRVCRRPFGLSYAAMAGTSSIA